MSDTAVETTTPETPSEWFDHNVRATFHKLIDNVAIRTEQEKTVLHALVDGLDKNPDEIISQLEVAPVIAGGAGYVDPVTAQILADNAALRNDVRQLLDILKANAADAVTKDEATEVAKIESDLATPEPAAPDTQEPETVITPDPAQVPAPAPAAPAAPAPVPVPPPVQGS